MFELIIILALILMNGVFSGAEIAIVSLRRTRVQQLLEEGRKGASSLAMLRARPERFLATVQVGITVLGTTAAAFGGSSLTKHVEPLLSRIPWLANEAEEIALGSVVVAISYLSIVLGELVPKSLALRAGESYALVMAKPLLWLSYVANPIVWFLTASSNGVLRPFSDKTNFLEARISKEELLQMVEEAAESGALHEHASEIASRAFAFDGLLLRDVMIPRNRVDALPIDADADRIRRCLVEERRSRIPVFDGTFDNVAGYVSAKDIVASGWDGKPVVLKDLMRTMKIFPETVPAAEVLRFMRREHQRVAAVVDEYGAVSGLVTFEDLVEEIVGEVVSEHEDPEERFVRDADGSVIVRGDLPIRDFNRELDFELEGADEVTTMAGLCAKLASGIPYRGARLAANDGAILVVLDATARGVRRVRVVLPERDGPDAHRAPDRSDEPRNTD